MSNISGGKGSASRPFSVDKKTYDDNFDRIFSKKKPKDDFVANKSAPELSNDPNEQTLVVRKKELGVNFDPNNKQHLDCARQVYANISEQDLINRINNKTNGLNDLVVETIPVSEETFEFITDLIENPPEPNQMLIDAMKQQLKKD